MISTSTILDDGALAPWGTEPHQRWVASLPKFLREILEDEYHNEQSAKVNAHSNGRMIANAP